MTDPIQEPIEVAWRTIEYLREELRAAHATIGDLRLRLAATERHCHDLQAIVETLRGQLTDVNTALAAAYEESAALRGQLAEAGAIAGLLPDVTP